MKRPPVLTAQTPRSGTNRQLGDMVSDVAPGPVNQRCDGAYLRAPGRTPPGYVIVAMTGERDLVNTFADQEGSACAVCRKLCMEWRSPRRTGSGRPWASCA
jgi:hypothetical protein